MCRHFQRSRIKDSFLEEEAFELDLEEQVRSNSLGMNRSRRAERILGIRCGMVKGGTAQVMCWEQQGVTAGSGRGKHWVTGLEGCLE